MSCSVQPGDGLHDLSTPALVVDLDALERNLQLMAHAVGGSGVALRPHSKSHKCPDIAKAQMALGAVGVCCQTVHEAAVMVQAGVPDVLVTNEIVGLAKLRDLASLARSARIAVLADNEANVHELATAAAEARVHLRVLVEVDVGANRCGVEPGGAAAVLAQAIAAVPWLQFGGIHAYHGGAQHRRTPAERVQAIARAAELALLSRNAVEASGLACPTVTGAGTGTWQLERDSGVYTELQPGSYIFMDADYGRNALAPEQHAFEQSLFVVTTVMSTPRDDRCVVDAGLKALAFDSGPPLVRAARGLVYARASDEHGIITVDDPLLRPGLGERLWLVPGHCDPTVNLHDCIVGMRGGRVETVYRVAARGY
ncbi:MAG: DSD1 family PLP-dependent enzyme [Pseudomonadota bacterium]|nr:DSD1 family PLP-dependent enzyme [Pseudomonadota bacterium]